jgi:hypothetical protein
MFAGIIALSLIIIANLIRKWKKNRSQLPKGFVNRPKIEKASLPEDITRDRFLMSKIPENIDCIIIGRYILFICFLNIKNNFLIKWNQWVDFWLDPLQNREKGFNFGTTLCGRRKSSHIF